MFVSEIHFWKYSRNALEFFVEFLYAKTKYLTEEEPQGRPRGQRHPSAAAWGQPVGGARPCPWDPTSRPSDAYKIPKTLKTSGRPLFSINSTPTRRQLEP